MENCSIVTKPALNLVGISYCGPYSTLPDEAIRLQAEFLSRKHEFNGAVKSSVVYSPYYGNEAFAAYWACYETEHMEEVPAGMVQLTIPEHSYAMVACSNKRIGEGYEQLNAWMQEQGLKRHEQAVSLELFYIDERHWEEEPVELLVPLRDL